MPIYQFASTSIQKISRFWAAAAFSGSGVGTTSELSFRSHTLASTVMSGHDSHAPHDPALEAAIAAKQATAGPNVVILPRNSNQALGIAHFCADFMAGKLGTGPAKVPFS
jgi:hypothetical protein